MIKIGLDSLFEAHDLTSFLVNFFLQLLDLEVQTSSLHFLLIQHFFQFVNLFLEVCELFRLSDVLFLEFLDFLEKLNILLSGHHDRFGLLLDPVLELLYVLIVVRDEVFDFLS
jgi:hypothetical protein